MSVMRGAFNPLIDRWMERDATVQELTRELDSRASEEQPTSVSAESA
jgi:hypothetical protein